MGNFLNVMIKNVLKEYMWFAFSSALPEVAGSSDFGLRLAITMD